MMYYGDVGPLYGMERRFGAALMGISIEATRADGPPPYGVRVTLECDNRKDFFCRGFEVFEHVDSFIGAHADAMRSGWLERQTGQGRDWLCPRCSGKVSG